MLDSTDVTRWFLNADERRNPASDIRTWTSGNHVQPLIDGTAYFRCLVDVLKRTTRGDQVYFVDFRGDIEEKLTPEGLTVGDLLRDLANRGVSLFGLIWRSQPGWLDQSEEKNAELAREITDAGGAVLLDARTRRGGSHHQKFVVVRHPQRRDLDIAFAGGIDLGLSRHDTTAHGGDRQAMDFPKVYGPHPSWHDVQVSIQGPAIADIEHTFRERWDGNPVLDIPSPLRMLLDRALHAGAKIGPELPAQQPDPATVGSHAVQILRTYPARLRRYPFAPLGERSIAHAYRKAFARARRLIYIEDQYLWAPFVAELLAEALVKNPDLHLVAVVPRFPDKEGLPRWPSLVGREQAIKICRRAGGERFGIYDLENEDGDPVYVHAKVVVIDDVWAMVGSDNLNRRSWTHDSELSCAVLDTTLDPRHPSDPAGLGDGARVFARDLRLQLWREHLGRSAEDDLRDLLDPAEAFAALRDDAAALAQWHEGGRSGERPKGRLRPHVPERLPRRHRPWAVPIYRELYDPDGRSLRDRITRTP